MTRELADASRQANALAAEGQTEKAIDLLRAALASAISKSDRDAIVSLCSQLCVHDGYARGPLSVALWATLALDWEPQSARFLYQLADAYWHLGVSDRAHDLAIRAKRCAEQGDQDVLELLATHTDFKRLE